MAYVADFTFANHEHRWILVHWHYSASDGIAVSQKSRKDVVRDLRAYSLAQYEVTTSDHADLLDITCYGGHTNCVGRLHIRLMKRTRRMDSLGVVSAAKRTITLSGWDEELVDL
jgi:hypothetical protein